MIFWINGGGEVAAVAGLVADAAGVARPVVGGGNQLHGGAVAVFGLGAPIAHRFVEQNGNAFGLLLVCLAL